MADRDFDKEFDSVKRDLAALRSDIEKLVKSAAEAAEEKGQATFDSAKRFATESSDALGKKIEEQPVVSVLSAFGIGLVVGALIRR